MKKITSLWLALLMVMGVISGCSGKNASSVGVIGGSDGPTSVIVPEKNNNSENPSQAYDDDYDDQYDDYDDQYDDDQYDYDDDQYDYDDDQYDYDDDQHDDYDDQYDDYDDNHSYSHHDSNGTTQNSTSSSSSSGEQLGAAVTGSETITSNAVIEEEGCYTSKKEVALYIMKYGMLPGNYITKKEARALGWSGGSLDKFAPGKSIGGDRFQNYEGALPAKNGRIYTECDIDSGSKRGAKRIIFSNDGLIFYTDDHYETFTQLTGNE